MPIFPSVFYIYFLTFCCVQHALLIVLFRFFSFVNSFKFFSKQVNVTEVEVSVEIEQ